MENNEKRTEMLYSDILNLHVGDCVVVAGLWKRATVVSIFETHLESENDGSFERTVEVEVIHKENGAKGFTGAFCFRFDKFDPKRNQTVCKFFYKII